MLSMPQALNELATTCCHRAHLPHMLSAQFVFLRAQVDRAALDAQVRERRERKAAEAEAARAAALAAAEHERSVQLRAAAAMEARHVQNQGTDAFRHRQEVRANWRERRRLWPSCRQKTVTSSALDFLHMTLWSAFAGGQAACRGRGAG